MQFIVNDLYRMHTGKVVLLFACTVFELWKKFYINIPIDRKVELMREIDISYDWVDIVALIGGAAFLTLLIYGFMQL